MIADEIAVPFTILCRRIFFEGCWPEIWKTHHIVPLYKRSAVYAAGNYRGVHLTSILSKVAQRVIAAPLVRYLQINAFDVNQWAFTKNRNARDLATLCVSSWILGICTGKKIGAYLSDISGAFDRVCKDFLMAKLYAAGNYRGVHLTSILSKVAERIIEIFADQCAR